jgi:hypothetical protein
MDRAESVLMLAIAGSEDLHCLIRDASGYKRAAKIIGGAVPGSCLVAPAIPFARSDLDACRWAAPDDTDFGTDATQCQYLGLTWESVTARDRASHLLAVQANSTRLCPFRYHPSFPPA